MKSYLKITLFILPVVFYLAHPSSVQSFSPTGIITIGMDYQKGQLLEIVNEDVGARIVSTQSFTTPSPKSYPLYTAELYDSNNNLLTTTLIDQRNIIGVPSESQPLNGTSGMVMITIPFDPSLAKVVFKNEKGQTAGETRLISDFFCNFNNVCESQLGENSSVCSVDCYSSPTYTPVDNTSPSVSPVVQPRSKAKIFLPLLVWFGLAVGIGAGYFIIKRRNAGNF